MCLTIIRFQLIGRMTNLFVQLKIRFKVFLNVKRAKDNRTKIYFDKDTIYVTQRDKDIMEYRSSRIQQCDLIFI